MNRQGGVADGVALNIVQGSFGRVVRSPIAQPMAAHVHHHCHILMNAGGHPATCMVDEVVHPFTADNAIMVNAWERHCLRVAEGAPPATTLAFYIEPNWLGRLAGVEALCGAQRFFGRASMPLSPAVRRLKARLVEMMVMPATVPPAEIEACIFSLVDRLLRENPAPAVASGGRDLAADAAIGHAAALIREARGFVPDLGDLAREVGLSRPRFFDRFRDVMGAPPGLFANYVRFETALAELSEPDIPLVDISLDLGFSEQSNFTRFFRKHFGAPPLAYRRSLGALDRGAVDRGVTMRRSDKTQPSRLP